MVLSLPASISKVLSLMSFLRPKVLYCSWCHMYFITWPCLWVLRFPNIKFSSRCPDSLHLQCRPTLSFYISDAKIVTFRFLYRCPVTTVGGNDVKCYCNLHYVVIQFQPAFPCATLHVFCMSASGLCFFCLILSPLFVFDNIALKYRSRRYP